MQQSSITVGAYEAKTHLTELLEKVEAGQEIVITKHGAPVAKLVPVRKEASAEETLKTLELGALSEVDEAPNWKMAGK